MNDPAFLFYPGDYLRDTQCLSENVQVAYDRVMCEHMRNICITQQQLKFFTKKLTPEEFYELMLVLTPVENGYQIKWVAESIEKRKAYSDSRRKNREGSTKKSNKICTTYVHHMENEIENEIENINETEIEKPVKNIVKSTKPSIPTYFDFKNYALENQPETDLHKLELKYKSWVENGWKDGKGQAIKNWKSKLLQTLPYLIENLNGTNSRINKHDRGEIRDGVPVKTTWD